MVAFARVWLVAASIRHLDRRTRMAARRIQRLNDLHSAFCSDPVAKSFYQYCGKVPPHGKALWPRRFFK